MVGKEAARKQLLVSSTFFLNKNTISVGCYFLVGRTTWVRSVVRMDMITLHLTKNDLE